LTNYGEKKNRTDTNLWLYILFFNFQCNINIVDLDFVWRQNLPSLSSLTLKIFWYFYVTGISDIASEKPDIPWEHSQKLKLVMKLIFFIAYRLSFSLWYSGQVLSFFTIEKMKNKKLAMKVDRSTFITTSPSNVLDK